MAAVLPRVTPYRDYLAWIAAQDRAAALRPGGRLWRDWRRPRVWRRPIAARRPVAPERITVALSETLTAALTRQARQQGLTLNTLIQAAGRFCLAV